MSGDVALPAVYGRDRETGEMVMPLRERLGLSAHQSMSPALEDYLCFSAINTTSYGRAAESARKIGIPVDGSQIQRLVQRIGERAETQTKQRVSSAFDLQKRKEIVRQAKLELEDKPFSMIVMLDGTMLRTRGTDWGLKPVSALGERVVWHELKAALVIRVYDAPAGKRPKVEKYYVSDAGGPEAIGKKLYAEALRRGLEQAQRVYVIADGATWIWGLAAEHFPESMETLDFYHASEHLWALGRVLCKDNEEEAEAWVSPLLSTLKYHGGKELLPVLEELLKTPDKALSAEQCKALNREVAYFRNHADRLDYPKAKRLGMPLGSGSMESACSQIQNRFKCTGQFWSKPGERNLLALEMAWRNRDWNALWALGAA
jgi:hypothetical protein